MADDATAHVAKVMVSLRVEEMEKGIRARGGKPKGMKPEKAKRYAELYTPEELQEYLDKKNPALSEKRWDGIIENVRKKPRVEKPRDEKPRESILDFLRAQPRVDRISSLAKEIMEDVLAFFPACCRLRAPAACVPVLQVRWQALLREARGG